MRHFFTLCLVLSAFYLGRISSKHPDSKNETNEKAHQETLSRNKSNQENLEKVSLNKESLRELYNYDKHKTLQIAPNIDPALKGVLEDLVIADFENSRDKSKLFLDLSFDLDASRINSIAFVKRFLNIKEIGSSQKEYFITSVLYRRNEEKLDNEEALILAKDHFGKSQFDGLLQHEFNYHSKKNPTLALDMIKHYCPNTKDRERSLNDIFLNLTHSSDQKGIDFVNSYSTEILRLAPNFYKSIGNIISYEKADSANELINLIQNEKLKVQVAAASIQEFKKNQNNVALKNFLSAIRENTDFYSKVMKQLDEREPANSP